VRCFACGVLSSADLKNSFSFDANHVDIDAHTITRRLWLLEPLHEYIDRETSDLQIPGKIE
jgi:hypothetical protein